jgi:hypothetical protein
MEKFGKCHKGYNSADYMTDSAIDELGMFKEVACYWVILTFNYRERYHIIYGNLQEGATVLPKMHIMEDHTIPWLRRYHVGAGLMGEQGAESVHALMMRLNRTYQGIPNATTRLKHIMTEHTLGTNPSLLALRPPVNKRKKLEEEE